MGTAGKYLQTAAYFESCTRMCSPAASVCLRTDAGMPMSSMLLSGPISMVHNSSSLQGLHASFGAPGRSPMHISPLNKVTIICFCRALVSAHASIRTDSYARSLSRFGGGLRERMRKRVLAKAAQCLPGASVSRLAMLREEHGVSLPGPVSLPPPPAPHVQPQAGTGTPTPQALASMVTLWIWQHALPSTAPDQLKDQSAQASIALWTWQHEVLVANLGQLMLCCFMLAAGRCLHIRRR